MYQCRLCSFIVEVDPEEERDNCIYFHSNKKVDNFKINKDVIDDPTNPRR